MGRNSGCLNQWFYKYEVEDLTNDMKRLFISQKEIIDHTDLKRTSIYYLVNDPENKGKNYEYRIKRLESPLPVFDKTIVEDENGKTIRYTKIIYPINN